jgi:nucleotide-binding universal stress UspA family protein
LDGSPAAAAALPRALALAAAQAAAVSVVRVVPAGGAVAGPLSALQAAATDLAAVAARLQAAGLPPQRLRLALRVGRCPETALDQARREAADWLFLPPVTTGGQAVLTRPGPECS